MGEPGPPEPRLDEEERRLFQRGVDEFNRGFYFECHDTLEDLWSGLRGPVRDFFQGLIQVSVAHYHLGNGNLAGAASMARRARKRFARYPDRYFGFDLAAQRAELTAMVEAIDRGEVQGLCLSAETLTNMRGGSFKSGEWRPILQAGLTVSPDFPDVPFILDRAKTTEQKQTLGFLFASQAFGRPYLAPPGLPPERFAMLRKAFDETMRDPNFLVDVAKQRLKVSSITGAAMDRMIAEMKLVPKDIVAVVAKLMGSGEAN